MAIWEDSGYEQSSKNSDVATVSMDLHTSSFEEATNVEYTDRVYAVCNGLTTRSESRGIGRRKGGLSAHDAYVIHPGFEHVARSMPNAVPSLVLLYGSFIRLATYITCLALHSTRFYREP